MTGVLKGHILKGRKAQTQEFKSSARFQFFELLAPIQLAKPQMPDRIRDKGLLGSSRGSRATLRNAIGQVPVEVLNLVLNIMLPMSRDIVLQHLMHMLTRHRGTAKGFGLGLWR